MKKFIDYMYSDKSSKILRIISIFSVLVLSIIISLMFENISKRSEITTDQYEIIEHTLMTHPELKNSIALLFKDGKVSIIEYTNFEIYYANMIKSSSVISKEQVKSEIIELLNKE